MFAFLVDPTRQVNDGTDSGLYRGFFVWNSEVGASSFGIMTFLWRGVCGNHIVWGAENVRELRIIHTGKADVKAWNSLAVEVRKYADASVSDEEAQIESARRIQIGGTKEETIEAVYSALSASVRKRDVVRGYELAELHSETDGSPHPRSRRRPSAPATGGRVKNGCDRSDCLFERKCVG